MLASGLARLATRPFATASPMIAITMGIVVVACFAWMRRRGPVSNENIDIHPDELCDEARKPIVVSFCPAKLNANVRAFNVAEFAESRSE